MVLLFGQQILLRRVSCTVAGGSQKTICPWKMVTVASPHAWLVLLLLLSFFFFFFAIVFERKVCYKKGE